MSNLPMMRAIQNGQRASVTLRRCYLHSGKAFLVQPNLPRHIHLEREQKFNVSRLLCEILGRSRKPLLLRAQYESDPSRWYQTEEGLDPIIRCDSTFSIERQPDRKINDRYFDCDDALSARGVWIRERTERMMVPNSDLPLCTAVQPTAVLEAKHRMGGDFVNSAFEEVQGESAVKELIQKILPGTKLEELRILADLSTIREAWTITADLQEGIMPKKFNIVIDHTTVGATGPRDCGATKFSHLIGEVEMTRDIDPITWGGDVDQCKKEHLNEMEKDIAELLQRHPSLFPTQPLPRGKLTAYLEWKRLRGIIREELKNVLGVIRPCLEKEGFAQKEKPT